jgi:hypothetical protein
MPRLLLYILLTCAPVFFAGAGASATRATNTHAAGREARGFTASQRHAASRKRVRRAKRKAAKACAASGAASMSTDKFEELSARARARGSVSVVVKLCVPFRPEGELSDADARRQRAAIARAQDALLKELRGARVANVKRYEYTPFIALEVDAGALRRLRSSASVAEVTEDAALPAATQ